MCVILMTVMSYVSWGLIFFLMEYRHLLFQKQLVLLTCIIIAAKETSGSHVPFSLLGKITHRGVCLFPCDLFELLCFGFVLRSLQELVSKPPTVSVLMAETMFMTARDLDCLGVE